MAELIFTELPDVIVMTGPFDVEGPVLGAVAPSNETFGFAAVQLIRRGNDAMAKARRTKVLSMRY
jgi:hypothetical protein